MTGRRARDAKKEASWRRRLQKHSRSGLTVREFCEANGVTESSFHHWKRELARRDGQTPVGRSRQSGTGTKSPKRNRSPVASLLPVAIGPPATWNVPLEVSLPGGVTVRVSASCDPDTFRMVLKELGRS